MRLILLLLLSINTATASTAKIIADKVAGTITVTYNDSSKVETSTALFGKVKSNELNMYIYDHVAPFDNITPAGTFTIKKIYSWRLQSDMLIFIQGKTSVAAIHPVWTGNKDQRRVQRLLSTTPDDNRITGGCINVLPKFFNDVLSKLPDGTELTVLPE